MRYIIVFFLFVFYACTDELNVYENKDDNKLVIEGQIVNKITNSYVESYVRLSKSKLGVNKTGDYWNDGFTYVNDAVVIVKDDLGIVDTFSIASDSLDYDWTDPQGFCHQGRRTNYNFQKGYYTSNKLNPRENQTFYLTIQYQGKEYHSNCFMPVLPKMDSISFKMEVSGNDEMGNTPYLYFKDPPNEKNYYLFVGLPAETYWNFIVLDDKLINPDVKGINIFSGVTNTYWRSKFIVPFSPYHLEVHSLTKEAFNYYDVLGKLFINDGGNYKPSPASPNSNIDNGGLGFFRASSVHIFEGIIYK